MKLNNFSPLVSLTFFNEYYGDKDLYNSSETDVIGLITKYTNSGNPKEQHLLNVDDIPDLIDILNQCVNSSGNKTKKRRTRKRNTNLVQKSEPLERRIMHYKNDSFGMSCSWIVPEKYYLTANGESPERIKWPEMLFVATSKNILKIYCVGSNNDYPVYIKFKNISNVFDDDVCLGNSRKLSEKDIISLPINKITQYFEGLFFESLFSPRLDVKNHEVNYKLKDGKHSLEEILQGL